MSLLLPRLLLLAFLVTNLESFASLESSETSHDDNTALHIHETDTSDTTNTDEEVHCSHCFHHHGTGLLTQPTSLAESELDSFTKPIPVLFDPNQTTPPTPPPNIQA